MHIEIREKVDQQPNGDRDTQRHDSSSFFVVLVNGDKSTIAFQNNQFDAFHCQINGTRAGYLHEAQAWATDFGETIGCEVDLIPRKPATKIKKGFYIVEVLNAEMGGDGVLYTQIDWDKAVSVKGYHK